jgi:glycosyltransferase involved in cell wall biosynthesis
VHTNDGGWNKQPGARCLASKYFHRIHNSFGDAIRSACRDADVLVAWGGVDPKRYAPELCIPIVQTSHTTEPAPLDGGGFRSASHLAAVSEAAIAHFAAHGRADEVTVIYNGADLHRCRASVSRTQIREQWGLADHDIAVGYIGRHSPEKNPRAAIQAVGRLPRKYYAIYYGGPTPRDKTTTLQLRDEARQLAPGRVVFRPSIEQVGDVLGGLDVFMLASRREAFSLGLIEAWLSGVPVVATSVGSLPELERRFGRLTVQVPLNASDRTLARAVRHAHGDTGRDIAAKAKNIAEEHFTSEAMSHRWADYLQQIVSPRARADGPRRSNRNRPSIVVAN